MKQGKNGAAGALFCPSVSGTWSFTPMPGWRRGQMASVSLSGGSRHLRMVGLKMGDKRPDLVLRRTIPKVMSGMLCHAVDDS
ncbi:hypothetical protein DMH17_07370 [Raoultella planticola]|nr:hypothetical protein [Raoultella planticola]